MCPSAQLCLCSADHSEIAVAVAVVAGSRKEQEGAEAVALPTRGLGRAFCAVPLAMTGQCWMPVQGEVHGLREFAAAKG